MFLLPSRSTSSSSGAGGRLWRTGVGLLLTLCLRTTSAELDNETSPTFSFRSRPDLHAPILDFTILRPELLTPGYLFLAPYRNVDPGPYIYDNWGQLVYTGAGEGGPKTAHAPRVCTYKGTDHICYFEGEQHQGFARGHGVIMDQNYRVVKQIESGGAGASSDMHEFKMTPYSNGTTVLMTVYQPRQYDLTTNPRFNVEGGMGWIVEGVFQEVEIETGRVVFEWRSLDHVDPGLSWTMPGTTDTSGDGLTEQSPWDYFHINSIDKNIEGDYLISARHVSAIYKISGKDGHIMWQLGGNAATVRWTNVNMGYQHHARWQSENSTHTILSIYDNGSNSYNYTNQFSHGWLMQIDHVAGEAEMTMEWGAPEAEGGLMSGSQGSMQMLPNGGVHLCWGEHAYVSEHTADGSAVMYGKFAERESNVMIYRSGKYNWTGTPETTPALFTYSRIGEKMGFWVSWNGATEVRSWNFYIARTASGPWTFVGNAEKNGFETEYHAPSMAAWAYAEALDHSGRVLKASVVQKTWMPSEDLVPHCHDRGCESPRMAPETSYTAYEEQPQVDEKYDSTNRGFNTSHYYMELPSNTTTSNRADKAGSIGKDDNGSGIARDIFFVALGFVSCFAMMVLALFLYTRGAFDSIARRTGQLSESVTRSAFGSRVLGRYTRVHQQETDGFGSGSSSSSAGSRFA